MICLTLTRPTLSEALDDLRLNLEWIDLVELRADRLQQPDAEVVARAPAEIARVAGDGAAPACILTVRRPADGGSWAGSEEERLEATRRVRDQIRAKIEEFISEESLR